MRVLVTGGTGFVGAHTVRALVDDGHDVRLLVRRPAQVPLSLEPLGVDPDRVEVVTAPITDPAAVGSAMGGCGGVVHAAAVYSWDPRKAEEMERTNATATEVVLRQALAAGAGLVVHVSSTVALSRRGGGRLDRDAPTGDLEGSYIRSKQDSDLKVRAMQAAGAPVVRVHPCGQIGPNDPYLNPSNAIVRDTLRGLYPMWPTGGMPWGDARDTAATIAAVMAGRGDGAAAWISPCHNLADGRLVEVLRDLTGRRLPAVVLPGGALAVTIRTTRPLVRALPSRISLPLPQEGATELAAAGNVFDDTATVDLLGVPRRDLHESLGDTLRWMVSAGHLSARQAGRAAA